jgi:hypothetical protein
MPTIHLTYGGSTASRTINCPGWVKASEGIPRRPAGQAAIDGSMHHEIMERCQKEGKKPEDYNNMIYVEDGIKREFTEDDFDLSNIAYNATNDLLDDLDIDQLEIEPFVQLVPGVAGGSIDLLGLSADGKKLLVADYKFGSYKVSPKDSAQLALYAISAQADSATADLFDKVDMVVFAIIQPKVKGVVSTWTTTLSKLKQFEKEFRNAMERDDITPGSHCKYCPAEPYCEAKRASIAATNLLGARELTELQAAADMVEEVEAWVKSIHEEMYLQMNRGVPLKGWKVVEKRPTVKWIDAEAARDMFKEKRITARDITNPAALRTPKQVMDYLKKKGRELDLEEFIVSKSSGTTIATDDDSRDAVIVSDVQGHLADMMK